jgi:hypothetical protein
MSLVCERLGDILAKQTAVRITEFDNEGA